MLKAYTFDDLKRITTQNKTTKFYEGVLEKNWKVDYTIFACEIHSPEMRKNAMQKINSVSSWDKKNIIAGISNESYRYIVFIENMETWSIESYHFYRLKNELNQFDNYVKSSPIYRTYFDIEISSLDPISEEPSLDSDNTKVSRKIKTPTVSEKLEFLNKLKTKEEATKFLSEITTEQTKIIQKKKQELKVAATTIISNLKEMVVESDEFKRVSKLIKDIPYPFAIKFQKEIDNIEKRKNNVK